MSADAPIPNGVFTATRDEIVAMSLADAQVRMRYLARWLIDHFQDSAKGKEARRAFLLDFQRHHGPELRSELEGLARAYWQEKRR